MKQYNNEERLALTHRVFITEEVYLLLKKEKKKQNVSMAKIACNLIIKELGE